MGQGVTSALRRRLIISYTRIASSSVIIQATVPLLFANIAVLGLHHHECSLQPPKAPWPTFQHHSNIFYQNATLFMCQLPTSTDH
jgi:hypothetical protein